MVYICSRKTSNEEQPLLCYMAVYAYLVFAENFKRDEKVFLKIKKEKKALSWEMT